MSTSLQGKDYITTQEWSREELERTLNLAVELKEKQKTFLKILIMQEFPT